MSIILFCRIMLVDFSDVIRSVYKGKEASLQTNHETDSAGAGDVVSNYMESLFEEQTKDDKND